MNGALSDAEWLAEQFGALTVERNTVRPSEWAEETRYLPASVTSMPGFFRFDVTPYMREPLDCMSPDSPVREVVVMKGVQVAATTALLENAIGYYIDHVKTAPMMMVTADAELAKLRMESYVRPMIQHSGLQHLIRASDPTNKRKTGNTDAKLEWVGDGFLVPFGAKNANKLRSLSIQVMLRDEIDGWPDVVGKDGDPIKLSTDRTAAYEASRKILDISTPLLKGSSKIAKRYRLGDQRKYFVRCLVCGFAQVLRWRHESSDGEVTGMSWETEGGLLVPGSVRYLCQNCSHGHTNDDKTRLMDPANGAEWRPTAKATHPWIRSYHLPALYSPPGMQSWDECVRKWLEAWDVGNDRVRDSGALQVAYNNIFAVEYEVRGERVKIEAVSGHRRSQYRYGEVPNHWLQEVTGAPLLVVTCAVDVQARDLAVTVVGWAVEQRPVLLDYWRFEGQTDDLANPDTWGRLRDVIEQSEYQADDGKRYRIQLTFVDSGHASDKVYTFCAEYASGVYPVKGVAQSDRARSHREVYRMNTAFGGLGWAITVDIYKDRLSTALRQQWDGVSRLPFRAFSAPLDATEKQLKELTVEVKRQKVRSNSGAVVGYEWHRPSGADNELWDTLVYCMAGFDMIAHDYCTASLGMDETDWQRFNADASDGLFWTV